MRDDRERLADILEAIDRIDKYAVLGRTALESEDLLQTWVVHHLMILGEACRALSRDFRTRHPDEVWVLAAGLRNVIVHEYFGVDLEVVWRSSAISPHSNKGFGESLQRVANSNV